jgi:hypothetical protein
LNCTDLQQGHMRRKQSTLGSQRGQVIASAVMGDFLSGREGQASLLGSISRAGIGVKPVEKTADASRG